jgi:hypothetical protein
LRLNNFHFLQSTNPSVPHCIQQFPFFLLRSPKVTSSSYQWMSFFYWTLFIIDELYLIQVGHKKVWFPL